MSATNGNGAGTVILAEIKALRAEVAALMKHLGMGANGQPSGGAAGGAVADLADIQGQYGDVKIRMDPKRWKGAPMKGRTASQCPPEFLDIFAEQLEYFASKQEDPKKASYDRRDAARCRRWALEIREGRVKQDVPATGGGYPSDWDDGAPPARPTPHSAGNAPPDDWGDNRSDW